MKKKQLPGDGQLLLFHKGNIHVYLCTSTIRVGAISIFLRSTWRTTAAASCRNARPVTVFSVSYTHLRAHET